MGRGGERRNCGRTLDLLAGGRHLIESLGDEPSA